MFGIEFLSTMFLIHAFKSAIASFIIWGFLRYILSLFYFDLSRMYDMERTDPYLKKIINMFGLLLFVILLFFGTVGNTRIVIDPVQNYELRQYQENETLPEFVTPEERYEQLNGFIPLSTDSMSLLFGKKKKQRITSLEPLQKA